GRHTAVHQQGKPAQTLVSSCIPPTAYASTAFNAAVRVSHVPWCSRVPLLRSLPLPPHLRPLSCLTLPPRPIRSLHQAAATAISNHDFSVTLPKAKSIAFATHLLPCRLLPKTVHFNQFYNETPASHSPTPHVLPMHKKDCRQAAINAPSGGPLFRCFRASQDHFASPLPGHPCTSYRSCVNTMHTKNSPYLEGEAASATSFLTSNYQRRHQHHHHWVLPIRPQNTLYPKAYPPCWTIREPQQRQEDRQPSWV
ncbi:uncharacterized protein CCOS01_04521, partial [Colletotrichum costaricense]